MTAWPPVFIGPAQDRMRRGFSVRAADRRFPNAGEFVTYYVTISPIPE
jgi:hypothetical protein